MTDAPTSLATALLALQADLPAVAKRQTATTATYSYKYAGLPSVMSALLPRLNRLGIVFVARPVLIDGRPVLSCELIHVPSGDRMVSEYSLAVGANAPAQAIGSAISYGRRYSLTAMVGLVAEEDDDGRAASQRYDGPAAVREPARRTSRRRQEPEPDEGPRMISEPQSKKLHTLLDIAGHRAREDKLRYCAAATGRDITSSNHLTFREAALVISGLENAANEPHTEEPA